MKFYRAIRYIHASMDGITTLCGKTVSPTPVNTNLWLEADKDDRLPLCPKCKKTLYSHDTQSKGKQTTLMVKQHE